MDQLLDFFLIGGAGVESDFAGFPHPLSDVTGNFLYLLFQAGLFEFMDHVF